MKVWNKVRVWQDVKSFEETMGRLQKDSRVAIDMEGIGVGIPLPHLIQICYKTNIWCFTTGRLLPSHLPFRTKREKGESQKNKEKK